MTVFLGIAEWVIWAYGTDYLWHRLGMGYVRLTLALERATKRLNG
jgi:hypothetical protein